MNKMKILPIFILSIGLLDFFPVSAESKAVYLPTFVPPLPRPDTAARVDNRLVKGPVRGPYDYQVRKLNNAMQWQRSHISLIRGVYSRDSAAEDGLPGTSIKFGENRADGKSSIQYNLCKNVYYFVHDQFPH